MKRVRVVTVAFALAGMVFAGPPEGMQWETAAIQAKIDAAAANGGGRVTVGKGVHPCRTLYLKSGVELHLEEGAVILGGTKPEDYDDAMPLDQVYTYSNAVPATITRKAFIFAKDAHGIAITGKGHGPSQPIFYVRGRSSSCAAGISASRTRRSRTAHCGRCGCDTARTSPSRASASRTSSG